MLLEAQDLCLEYEKGAVKALREVNLQIEEEEFVAILGPSGSGKSSLLQTLGALERPTAGEIFFRGSPLSRLNDLARFRSREVGFIFQNFHLFPTLPALENVQLPMVEMPWNAAERRERAMAMLSAVGLGHRARHRPCQMSGGERQRVAIARSLVNEPSFLLADEPTGNLDSETAALILELLCEVHRSRKMAVLLVTHGEGVAATARRVIHLRDGRIESDVTACSP